MSTNDSAKCKVATAGGFLLLSRFSETVAGLLDRRDERINRIDLEATTISGMALMATVIVAFIVEVAQVRTVCPTPCSARSPA